MALTVLGGHGFVGSNFVAHCKKTNTIDVKVNDRDDYSITTSDAINFISTTDNYSLISGAPLIDLETNLVLLVKLLESWSRNPHPSKCFNFISSWFVYGGENNHGVIEDRNIILGGKVPRLNGFYSITKAVAEALVIDYCNTFGLQYRILRLGNVIGKGDKKVSARKNVIQYQINRMKENKDIVVYDKAGGEYYRDFIRAEDAALAIQLVLTNGNMNDIYNIGNGQSLGNTVGTILEYCKRELGSRSKIIYKRDEERQTSMYLNVDKIKALGYVPYHERSRDAFEKYDYLTMFDDLLEREDEYSV